jgi:hypothetical protein
MSIVVSFADYTPPARFDDLPWTQVRIEEGATSAGTWTLIDTLDISPVDSDPSRPGSHDFTTVHGTAVDLWYRLTYVDAASSTSAPTDPVQNLQGAVAAYATTDDLFRILKVRSPTSDQTAAAQGDLDTATIEINAEISLLTDQMTSADLELCKGVCLDRAADLWRHRESAPGILGITDEVVPTQFGRYSWERYAQRLAPLKEQWGIA